MEWNEIITSAYRMFYNCTEIIEIDMTKFDTSLVNNMFEMFALCYSLKSLDVSNLTTTNVETMEGMFFNCFNLISINLESFNISSITSLNRMFYNCKNLEYINIQNFDEKLDINVDEIFYGIPNNTVACIISQNNENSVGEFNMSHTGSDSITTCSHLIYDEGGPNGIYGNLADSMVTIYPKIPEKFIAIKGTALLETNCCDYIYIYDGVDTSGKLLGKFFGSEVTIPLVISETGPLTLRFTSDTYKSFDGFQLTVSCLSKIRSNLEKNNCRKCSCDNNWRNFQNKIIPENENCVNTCSSTDNKLEYRGKCYNECPVNTTSYNSICYSNEVLEKCKLFSIESDYENLCIQCNDNYYPKLNDKTNRKNFINCYKKNSLDKYYLDEEDFFFKPCYKSCQTCLKNGTKENHYCTKCDLNYEFNLTFDEYYNCYPKCDYYFYLDNEKNYICTDELKCPDDYNNFIEEKKQCIDKCFKDSEFKYEFRKQCFKECPEGYYLKDSNEKIIEKCHTNCRDCDEPPTSNNNSCKSCFSDKYLYYGNCIPENTNQIIYNKELTSIIKYYFDDNGSYNATISTTSLGNLICCSSYFYSSIQKYYYGIKSNGRPYFTKDNKETEFMRIDYSDDIINEGNLIYSIQLLNLEDNKEYIISIGNSETNFELNDFNENIPIIYAKSGKNIFENNVNSFKYGSLIKLKHDNDNHYLLCLFLTHSNGFYYELFKLSFSEKDIKNYNPIIKKYSSQQIKISFVSC